MKYFISIVVVILFLGAGFIGYTYWKQSQDAKNNSNNVTTPSENNPLTVALVLKEAKATDTALEFITTVTFSVSRTDAETNAYSGYSTSLTTKNAKFSLGTYGKTMPYIQYDKNIDQEQLTTTMFTTVYRAYDSTKKMYYYTNQMKANNYCGEGTTKVASPCGNATLKGIGDKYKAVDLIATCSVLTNSTAAKSDCDAIMKSLDF